MGLTTGSGPFGSKAAGSHNAGAPERFVLVDPFSRRVRATREGRTVVDSDAVDLVHVTGALPHYAFPAKDVHIEATDDPDAPGKVTVPWDAVDAWFEEDERVFVHPRDPYHRVDTFLTSRRVEVRLGDTLIAASTRARALYETSLPVRYYVPRADVAMEHLERVTKVTECPYKGTARYWSVRASGRLVENGAWSYEHEVRREGEHVHWLVAFDDQSLTITVDGARKGR